ncbi:MAG: LPXTG cell wall anchor domain-containing protein, partial [Oscillospiraceae bacterium]|nr:LPXTG cell wall anchor domain-containing protein [Oscillospiraceae bacterium]
TTTLPIETTTTIETTTLPVETTTTIETTTLPVETTTTETTSSTIDTTTTEATSSTIDTTTTIETTTTALETTKEPTATTVTNIASDEELCNWAVNDYKSKNDFEGNVNAVITKATGSQYEITLTDDSENVLDVYVIDPVTGIGTDSNNEEVNLPQTGNNSLKDLLTVFGGFMATGFGLFALKKSRCKEENQ